ncbi:glycosyltransferase family 2 protein [Pectinatus frisingensis]|uniref:glycosyltransferase family 2 protein n=1 Tax=Pectinatus frisingensis TaxID=865 RepID=UPI0018C5A9C7|nr:glycosyltransferase [Pectinatus frisingensis]
MNEKPLVTVLMPVYNSEKYLREAINSILQQSFANFELLIMDGGSTDSSNDIIRSYDDKRIRLVLDRENAKLVPSLNKGIELSRGKYIARMDSDDICASKRLEKQVNFLDNNLNVGVCGTWIKTIGKSKNFVYKYPCEKETVKCMAFFCSPLAHPTVMMRKKFLLKNNLQYMYPQAEDWDLWYKASFLCDIVNIPEILLQYRISEVSATQRAVEAHKISVAQLMQKHCNDLGISVDVSDLDVCLGISKLGLVSFEKILDRAEKLLLKMKKSNKNKQIYNPIIFQNIIAQIWYYLCTNLTHSNIDVLHKYFESELRKDMNDNIKELKFFFKALVHSRI